MPVTVRFTDSITAFELKSFFIFQVIVLFPLVKQDDTPVTTLECADTSVGGIRLVITEAMINAIPNP